MSNTLPNCPKCDSEYTYLDNAMFVCPECAHEWDENSGNEQDDTFKVNDSNGTQLLEGDTVTLIKDLKVKGSSTVIKIGTKAKIYRLVESDHDLDCKVDGHGQMMLKSEFVKKQAN